MLCVPWCAGVVCSGSGEQLALKPLVPGEVFFWWGLQPIKERVAATNSCANENPRELWFSCGLLGFCGKMRPLNQLPKA